MRLGILGGTFDPIHEGHLAAGRVAAAALNLSRVLLAPAGNPWHRAQPPTASAEQRFDMAVAAVGDDPLFLVSRIDIDRAGNTYSVDLLEEVQVKFPDAELFLIMGADSYSQFENWRNPEAIRQLARLVVVSRTGQQVRPDEGITVVPLVDFDMSSTLIRERARAGEPLTGLVPPAVADYILSHSIYQ